MLFTSLKEYWVLFINFKDATSTKNPLFFAFFSVDIHLEKYHGAKSCVAYLFLSLEAVSRDMEHGAFNLIIVELMMRS